MQLSCRLLPPFSQPWSPCVHLYVLQHQPWRWSLPRRRLALLRLPVLPLLPVLLQLLALPL